MYNVHFPFHLPQMRSLPLDLKLLMSRRRIIRWDTFWNGEVYLQFSGGIKSIVLRHIINGILNDVPSVGVANSIDGDNLSKYINDIDIVESLKYYERTTKNKPYSGLMILNNNSLKKRWMERGCNDFKSDFPISMPLSFWSQKDLEEYIIKFKINI